MMIDTIGQIVYVTMFVSAAIMLLSAMLLADRVSKIRYEHRINSDRLSQVYWIIGMVSTMTLIASWVAMVIVAIVESIIK